MRLSEDMERQIAKRALEDAKAIPDRVSALEHSPFYDERCRLIGVRFRGADRKDVLEFSVRGRWVKIHTTDKRGHKKYGHRGKPITLRMRGAVEVYWRSEKIRHICPIKERRALDIQQANGLISPEEYVAALQKIILAER